MSREETKKELAECTAEVMERLRNMVMGPNVTPHSHRILAGALMDVAMVVATGARIPKELVIETVGAMWDVHEHNIQEIKAAIDALRDDDEA